MGYKGEEGFTKLISYLQILRARTGDASTAATQLQNVLGKYNSDETANKFEKMGINDFAAQMERASKSGKDMVEFLLDLTMKATKGDLTKLPQLFGDQEMRMAITTMIQARDEHKQLVAQLNSAEVNGGVMRDLNRILEDTQAKIDSLSVSWDRFMTALGSTAAGPLGGAMDWATERLAYTEAIQEGLKKEGIADVAARNAKVLELQIRFNDEELNRLARLGGFVPSSARYGDADTRLSPLQVERRTLERERDALDARKASIDSLRVLRGTPGAEHKERELTRVGADIGDVNAKINRTYPVDPDRMKPFIGSQVAPPMPPSRPGGVAAAPPAPDYRSQLQAVAAKVDGMNAHLAQMTGAASVNATVTDARQDNRQFPVTVSVNAPITVQQATQAPAALAGAVSSAVKVGVTAQPARFQSGPQE
jgi:hypothetical protein